MSTDAAKIEAILEDILTSGMSAEDACHDTPDLLPEIKNRLAQMRVLELHLDEVMPTCVIEERPSIVAIGIQAGRLPTIPGYQIEAVVGTGGMGVVYRARHLKLNRSVAIKMLLAGGFASALDLDRFKREAESIAALRHANIVQVFDAGDCEGLPFFVMEFMEGGTLAEMLAGTPQSARAAAELIRSIAGAVQAAHAAGIVHRDLKPSNLLLSSDGLVKVADFGLAGRTDAQAAAVTIAGTRMGTPSYMAPEQATGAASASSPLVDVYGLGAILYEMLTGRPPFRGENAAETARQVVNTDPVPPGQLNPETPHDLQTICLKCLQKDPTRRYSAAKALAEDLSRFLRGDAIVARPVGVAERVVKWCRRQPAKATLIGVVFVVLAATIVLGLWLERISSDRRAEIAIRRDRARTTIESALATAENLCETERWEEAESVFGAARSRLPDANSPALESRLESEWENLRIARELDRIRQHAPEPGSRGFDFSPARDGYAKVFARLGLGTGVSPEDGASRVVASPLRRQLLIALDTAAFIQQLNEDKTEQKRLLAMARLADPDPWRNQFRDSARWGNREALLQLAATSKTPGTPVPPHELVILGMLLSDLGDNDRAVEILREAQIQHPADFWLNHELGNAVSRAGKHAEALQFFRAAVAIQPSNHAAWSTLGIEISDHESPSDAIPFLRRGVELNPHLRMGWRALVFALSLCERWDEASMAIEQASQQNPGDPQLGEMRALNSLVHARSLARSGDWQNSAQLYRDAINRNYPDEGEACFEYAAVLLLANDASTYHQVCMEMLDKADKGRLRRFLAARAWTLTTNPPEEFDRVNQIGMQELGQSASVHWSLTERAALLCRHGQETDAVPLLQQSIAAKPAGAVLNWCWLACADARTGNRAAGQQWLAKVTSFGSRRMKAEFPPECTYTTG